MSAWNVPAPRHALYELRFRPLSDAGHGYSFPCGPNGVVDLDALSERARLSYFFVRSVIGREVGRPVVHAREMR